jgi:hypothetical protein
MKHMNSSITKPTNAEEPNDRSLKYLILRRDKEFAPTDFVADGAFVPRLYALLSDDNPASLDFAPNEMEALIALSGLMNRKPQLILTDGLKMLPGAQLLHDAFTCIATDTAQHQVDDFKHIDMQLHQSPAEELRQALTGVKKQYSAPSDDDGLADQANETT